MWEFMTELIERIGVEATLIVAFYIAIGFITYHIVLKFAQKKMDQDLASYSMKLKKSELFFKKQFEASNKIGSILAAFAYEAKRNYDLGTGDGLDTTSHYSEHKCSVFSKEREKIRDVLDNYRATLDDDTVDELTRYLYESQPCKNWDEYDSCNFIKDAEELEKILKDAIKRLNSELRGQIER